MSHVKSATMLSADRPASVVGPLTARRWTLLLAFAVLTIAGMQVGPVAAQRSNFCPSGLVWRERFDGDTVCVLPGERDQNRRQRGLVVGAPSACPSGLVWRERFDGDTVCVTPIERDSNRRRRGL